MPLNILHTTLIAAATCIMGLPRDAIAERPALAFAVNSPLSWLDSDALAASAYVGFAARHAIRINIARYEHWSDFDEAAVGLRTFGQDDGDGAARGGHFTDVGVGWMYFPRRLWSGPMFELGVLGRDNDISVGPSSDSEMVVTTQSKTIAGRALAGWSLLLGRHVFLSASLGFSIGYERGSETVEDYATMTFSRSVGRVDPSVEGFVRIGGALKL
jgi:hypothetical protein